MQPGWAEALPLVAGLMVGTMIGYGASLVLGRRVAATPAVAGRRSLFPQDAVIDRTATGCSLSCLGAFHPNQLAVGFAILGYFRADRVWRYFVVAGVAQLVWWSIYASAADLVASQNVVSSSNFQLYVAALFSRLVRVRAVFASASECSMSIRERRRAD